MSEIEDQIYGINKAATGVLDAVSKSMLAGGISKQGPIAEVASQMSAALSFDRSQDSSKLDDIEALATRLLVVIWRAMQAHEICERGRVEDATLRLRDTLNPNWPRDPEWLPEELKITKPLDETS